MIKDITVDELRTNYLNRKGFLIQSSYPLDDDALLGIAKMIDSHWIITDGLPEFIARIDNKNVAFVYHTDIVEPIFFQRGSFTTPHGIFLVEALSLYLKLTLNPLSGCAFNVTDFDNMDS